MSAARTRHQMDGDEVMPGYPEVHKNIEKLKERVTRYRREYDEASFDAMEEGR